MYSCVDVKIIQHEAHNIIIYHIVGVERIKQSTLYLFLHGVALYVTYTIENDGVEAGGGKIWVRLYGWEWTQVVRNCLTNNVVCMDAVETQANTSVCLEMTGSYF